VLALTYVDPICFLGVVELVGAHVKTHFEIVHLLLSSLFLGQVTVVFKCCVALVSLGRLALFGHA
jgi:hypothetical protein